MPRIQPIKRADADPRAQQLLAGVEKKLGRTPNLMATMAHSPAVLGSYLAFGQALSNASLNGALREQIAITVAGLNECGYCVSAHTAQGRKQGVDEQELSRNLAGKSSQSRTQAALDFAKAIVQQEGWVSDEQFRAVRDAGYTDAEVLEIVASVAMNIFSNYFNHVVGTQIDFPLVEASPQAAHS